MSDRDAVSRRPISSGSAAYTGTASAAVSPPYGATSVFVWCTSNAVVMLRGDATTATASNGIPLPAGTAVYLQCQPNDSLSAVRLTATDGTLYYGWCV